MSVCVVSVCVCLGGGGGEGRHTIQTVALPAPPPYTASAVFVNPLKLQFLQDQPVVAVFTHVQLRGAKSVTAYQTLKHFVPVPLPPIQN